MSKIGITNANHVTNWGKETTVNTVKTHAKASIATALGIGAGALAVKSQPVRDCFAKGVDKLGNLVNKGGKKALGIENATSKIKEYGSKIVEYAKANPKTAKAVGLVAAATTAVVGAIALNGTQKQGEINGKLKEKMEVQKALNE